MRRVGLITASCCFVAIVLGCGGIAGPVERRLVGDIGLAVWDTRDQRAVVELDGGGSEPRVSEVLVPATVFAVGWDESHVIAQRYPREEWSGPTDMTRKEYYIVVVRDKKVFGPFDEADFIIHCDLLGVAADLPFTFLDIR